MLRTSVVCNKLWISVFPVILSFAFKGSRLHKLKMFFNVPAHFKRKEVNTIWDI